MQCKRQSCFENGEIWYPQADKLNDPYECNPDFELLTNDEGELELAVNSLTSNELNSIKKRVSISGKEELLELLKTPNVLNLGSFLPTKPIFSFDFVHQIVFAAYLSAKFSNSISKIGILSLTENPLNLRMWAHYGGNSTGICLEFERNPSNILCSDRTKKVKYVKKRLKVVLHDRFKAIDDLVFTKSHIWKYEKEWRNYQNEGDKAFSFPGKILKVIFGLNCHDDTKQLIKSIFGTEIDYEEIILGGDYTLMSDCGFKHSISKVDLR